MARSEFLHSKWLSFMTKRLNIARNLLSENGVINIEEPKANVTKAEIDAAMQVVVENNIFNTSGGDLVEAVEGRMRTTTLNPIVD